MAVPAHDARDFEFAKKFNLPIKPVIIPKIKDEADKLQNEILLLLLSFLFLIHIF